MKTSDEIRRLKQDWCDDPCWDIEETEGFEEHRAELLAFRETQEAKWVKEREEQLLAKATQIGVPSNTVLAAYLLSLERQIHDLTEKLIGFMEGR